MVALVLAAWFALGIRESHEINTVTSIASAGRLTPPQVRRADDLLQSAGTLNPDRQVQLLRGQVALAAGRSGDAQRLFLQVGHAEPMNLNAWAGLVRAAGSNHGLIRLALDNIARLAPKVPAR